MVTIGLVLMVKNEAAIVADCIGSALPYITTATVLDTGSTDGTQGIVREALRGIKGMGHDAPFVDFGTSRSQLFRLAHRSADWLLCLDADQTVTIDEGFEPRKEVDAYMIEVGTQDFSYRLPLLLKGDREWRSYGVTHEYTALADGSLGIRENTDAVRVTHHQTGSSRIGKFQRDRLLLERAVEEDPSDGRSTYYLAQTLRDSGVRDEARRLYARRARMTGWEEERWHAQYQAALLTEPWPDQLEALLTAWEARPTRLEPLWHAIDGLRAHGQHRAAASLEATRVSYGPSDDILFVERAMWGPFTEEAS